jgi:hypothetical protein
MEFSWGWTLRSRKDEGFEFNLGGGTETENIDPSGKREKSKLRIHMSMNKVDGECELKSTEVDAGTQDKKCLPKTDCCAMVQMITDSTMTKSAYIKDPKHQRVLRALPGRPTRFVFGPFRLKCGERSRVQQLEVAMSSPLDLFNGRSNYTDYIQYQVHCGTCKDTSKGKRSSPPKRRGPTTPGPGTPTPGREPDPEGVSFIQMRQLEPEGVAWCSGTSRSIDTRCDNDGRIATDTIQALSHEPRSTQ